METGPRIRRLGEGLVNVYLLEEQTGITIIDAGAPAYWHDLAYELKQMNRSLDDVRAVVLTHAHSDHIGFAERIRSERGVPIQVHELDAAMARGDEKPSGQKMGSVRPLPLLRFLWFAMRHGMLRIKPIAEVATFGDGATLDVPGSPRVTLVPGHTEGSAALHMADHDALFVGDAFCTLNAVNGRRGPQLAPFGSDPARALESLRRLEGNEARLVLPGHGKPWTLGIDRAVELVRQQAA